MCGRRVENVSTDRDFRRVKDASEEFGGQREAQASIKEWQ